MRNATIFIALNALCTWTLAGNLQISVIDKEGKPVADAVVVVTPSAKVEPKSPLPALVTINQEKMRFIPEVSIVPVGGKLRLVNNDPWDHHVRSSPAGAGQFSTGTAGFEMRLEGKSDGKAAKFADTTLDKAGALSAVLLGCHIHGSMRGYVYVTDSPWTARTGADGVASFTDLPDGAARVVTWQADQLVDLPAQSVTVGPAPAKASFQLGVVPRRRRV